MPESVPQHRISTTERGSFCLARCDCGWIGMARRARSQARTDAERHLADAQGGPDAQESPDPAPEQPADAAAPAPPADADPARPAAPPRNLP